MLAYSFFIFCEDLSVVFLTMPGEGGDKVDSGGGGAADSDSREGAAGAPQGPLHEGHSAAGGQGEAGRPSWGPHSQPHPRRYQDTEGAEDTDLSLESYIYRETLIEIHMSLIY